MPAPLYGQVVCGPPGSGKTTYCNGMQQYLQLLGRNVAVINLDPANEAGRVLPPPRGVHEKEQQSSAVENESKEEQGNSMLPYETIFDVCEEVINLTSVMDQLGLGPNGGLVYCMEYLEAHVEDIIEMIQERILSEQQIQGKKQTYLIIDLPGQVELYTHSTCVQHMLQKLTKILDLRLTAVQLIDAHYCADATKFLSATLLGTTTMIRLELPMVSVLSKVDLLSQYGDLPFTLEFFTECHDLQRLVPFIDTGNLEQAEAEDDFKVAPDEFDYADDPDYQKARQKTRQSNFFKKRAKLHQALAEVVEDFGLLGFVPLDITDAESVGRVLARVDKCNGYVFTESSVNEDMFQCAVQSESAYESVADIQERLVEHRAQRRQQQQQQERPSVPSPQNYVPNTTRMT